jgi:hypothetical protein
MFIESSSRRKREIFDGMNERKEGGGAQANIFTGEAGAVFKCVAKAHDSVR